MTVSAESYSCAVVKRARGQRQDDDRRIRRIVFAIGGVVAQRGRQIGARRLNTRLHIARGAVDVAIEGELDDDHRRCRRS